MANDNHEAVNSLEEALRVSPQESEVLLDTKRKKLMLELPGRSFSVYKLKTGS
ncbi:hypothetical protein D9M68_945630 [compost metagenome]